MKKNKPKFYKKFYFDPKVNEITLPYFRKKTRLEIYQRYRKEYFEFYAKESKTSFAWFNIKSFLKSIALVVILSVVSIMFVISLFFGGWFDKSSENYLTKEQNDQLWISDDLKEWEKLSKKTKRQLYRQTKRREFIAKIFRKKSSKCKA